MMVRAAFFGVMALAMGGCSAVTDDGPFPETYKGVVRFILKSDKEPRAVAISAPAAMNGRPAGWLVCFRANSKNEFGAYAGLQVTAVVIRNDRPMVWGNQACRNASYAPWPDWNETPATRAEE
jgi:hypothetical protein